MPHAKVEMQASFLKLSLADSLKRKLTIKSAEDEGRIDTLFDTAGNGLGTAWESTAAHRLKANAESLFFAEFS